MFAIQEQKFNETISSMEPNLLSANVIGVYIAEELNSINIEQESISDGAAKNDEDRLGFEVLEIYPIKKRPITITKIEAIFIARHFGIIE